MALFDERAAADTAARVCDAAAFAEDTASSLEPFLDAFDLPHAL